MQVIRVQMQTVIDHLEAVENERRRKVIDELEDTTWGVATAPKYTDTPVVKPSRGWEARW